MRVYQIICKRLFSTRKTEALSSNSQVEKRASDGMVQLQRIINIKVLVAKDTTVFYIHHVIGDKCVHYH